MEFHHILANENINHDNIYVVTEQMNNHILRPGLGVFMFTNRRVYLRLGFEWFLFPRRINRTPNLGGVELGYGPLWWPQFVPAIGVRL